MPTIKFLGHACFLITTSEGVCILTDPYEPGGFGGQIGYEPITDPVDVALVSHEHADHNYVEGLPGTPQILRDSGSVCGLEFRAIASYHDSSGGQERGSNRIFVWEADGLRFCHLGDLGELLSPEQVSAIGPVDILFVPVGGTFTLDAEGAREVIATLQPRVAIPMHFQTSKVNLPIAPVSQFLRGQANLQEVWSSVWNLDKAALDRQPKQCQILVLTPAN